MSHRLAICLAIASLLFMAPRPAAAALTHTFNTVDAVEFGHPDFVTVTGILAGQSTPTTATFYLFDRDLAKQCQRIALLAMSKPGKYQLHVGGDEQGAEPGCKLTRRAL